MPRAIDQFRSNQQYVRDLLALYISLAAQTTPAIDLSDLLRAALVQIVSALDHYIHEAVREGMIDAYAGKRTPTQSFHVFPVPMQLLVAATAATLTEAQIGDAIREVNSLRTFQRPTKIAEAVNHVATVRVWRRVAMRMHIRSGLIQTRLNLIIDRRNQIAHEADLDPSNPGIRWPITHQDASNAVDFIGTLVEAIDAVI